MTENQQARQKLQDELRKLFQFDVSDLDFGIYRILNRKKDQIEQFIEKDLLDAIKEGLKEYQQQDASQLDAIKQQIIENLSDDAFDKQGKLVKYENTRLGKDYLEAFEKAGKEEIGADTEKKIYNDLFTFFSRYYDNGDFLSKRRISTRDSKYAVPYNGEEVLLHWANKDQYYIKSGEQFTSFKFDLDGSDKSVWFKVAQAETEKDNVKEEEARSFVLRPQNPIEVDGDELTLWFEYRPLAHEEEARWLNLYKKVENPRKTVDRSVLCIAYNEFVLNEVGKEWRVLLSRIPINKDRSILYQKLNHYTGKNTTDYFIHKNLKSFLERELEYYLKNEVIRVDDVIADQSQQAMEVALTRAKVVRHIGQEIIAFLSQIENFQKKLFEKRKFVVDTHYCFTLDMVPEEVYDTILENDEQLQSWEELYAMEKWGGELEWDGEWTIPFMKEHPYMMVDTRFFDEDFKYRLLESFENLTDEVEGLMINSENFQALNLLRSKYQNKIRCTYIDPPYNTGQDGFNYKDNYQHSSWLSFLNDRFLLGRKLNMKEGVFLASIDDNEVNRFRSLLQEYLGEDGFLGSFVWKRRITSSLAQSWLSTDHEYVLVYSKDASAVNILGDEKDKSKYSRVDKDDRKYASMPLTVGMNRYQRPNQWYALIDPKSGSEYWPPKNRVWCYYPPTMEEKIENDYIIWPDDFPDSRMTAPRLKAYEDEAQRDRKPVSTWIGEVSQKENDDNITQLKSGRNEEGTKWLNKLFTRAETVYPKPVSLLKTLVGQFAYLDHDIILDYYAGSGTTGHAILELNKKDGIKRKYILLEFGDFFEEILVNRLKKIVFSNNWKEGIPQDKEGQSHAFKYHFLESYEDALNNIDFKNPEDTQLVMEFDDYMLHYMLDFETEGVSATLLKEEAFDTPFDYQLNIQRGHGSPQSETVDMVETFHYLIGLWVQTLRKYEHQDRKYVVSKGQIRDEDAIEEVCIIWRKTKNLNLEEEAEWIQETILDNQTFDRIYINGLNKVKNAEPTELIFREKMFEELS
ncbi:site-specific DNA-methyltransferase [Membranicola marinus]|uniref:Site-specific DNA-methyltransferase n=1 Tax=Membranihabitans marinus TaxID=1227546 RepID=A0A953LA60_9BACT|nr:site-specific DNA-methyltransferase [Membranihabitans marinus]MBY5959580.1 site-specific DNA-methyltransferase [Membranihabitans marinus]